MLGSVEYETRFNNLAWSRSSKFVNLNLQFGWENSSVSFRSK